MSGYITRRASGTALVVAMPPDVLLPGVLPGAVPLGIYAAGVPTRLFADALETMRPQRPIQTQ